jgi:hypothetical protein
VGGRASASYAEGYGIVARSWNYFFLLLEISKLARSVTGTASTDMSVAAPVVMLCLFLSLELFSLMADILSVNQIFDKIIIVLINGYAKRLVARRV